MIIFLCLMLISNQYDSEGQERQPCNLSVSVKATKVLPFRGQVNYKVSEQIRTANVH